jgi:uncharacterized protein YbbC (DUF1343 family)
MSFLVLFLALAACGAEEPRVEASERTEEEAPVREVSAHDAPDLPEREPSGPTAPPVVRLAVQDQDRIDQAVRDAIRTHKTPGAVVVIGQRDGVVFRRAYGARAVVPSREPMTADTIFDLASLTKPIVTATSVMLLVEEGRLDLDSAVSTYLPGFDRRGKGRVTVRHLLLHTSGLPSVNPRSDYEVGREAAFENLFDLRLATGPGGAYRYSDINYILLGEIVARISGQTLDAFAQERIFGPLEMRETRFNPPPEWRARIAPTEDRDDVPIRGDVHDPRAWRLGGVAGNAGLFTTADDLARFASMMLRGGALDSARILTETRHAEMTASHQVPGGARTLGWDAPSSDRRARGYTARAYGHLGFTGTSLWIDPELDLFVIVLSNRVHPEGTGNVGPLLRAVDEIAIDARSRVAPPSDGGTEVLLGIDALSLDDFAALDGARVGLVTHAAARTRDGRRTLDVLHASDSVELVSLFAPEHGLSSQREGRLRGQREPMTGLLVHSLFGETRKPTPEMLANIDTIVVDLQDVGARFYTYGATVMNVLEAAAENDKRVVILDRPNPLGGIRVDGPVLDESLSSFVNYHALPILHGMTLGELAALLNAENDIGARLDVVGVRGWSRDMRWPTTGLMWFAPSPNLPSPTQVLLYPAVGLLESTPVSVGRGTDAPFELLGAPWMNGEAITRAVADEALPGVTVHPVQFTPRAGPHRRLACTGVRLTVTDPDAFEPVRTGLALARALIRVHPREWDTSRLARMIGRQDLVDALEGGATLDDVEALYGPELEAFVARRARFVTE